ncbi:MAG: segregation/condensation protein A [Peptococcaceae bacterium]|nr:segregation/condensation protein A [Peptococcaceae bacterium]
MTYQVVLPVYEGPLDLLLDLIDNHQLDIYNIPISFITGQYMDYLEKAQEIDLNLSGDFLVMAGTLLAIKAKMLLPRRETDPETGEPAEDPREELVAKLLEYRLYRENALTLKEMENSRSRIYFRAVDDRRLLESLPPINPIGQLSLMDLQAAFRQAVRTAKARGKVLEMPRETLTIQQQMANILRSVAGAPGGVPFFQLFEFNRIMDLVTAFMALLELLHKGRVWVRQKETFGEIFVFAAKSCLPLNQ